MAPVSPAVSQRNQDSDRRLLDAGAHKDLNVSEDEVGFVTVADLSAGGLGLSGIECAATDPSHGRRL